MNMTNHDDDDDGQRRRLPIDQPTATAMEINSQNNNRQRPRTMISESTSPCRRRRSMLGVGFLLCCSANAVAAGARDGDDGRSSIGGIRRDPRHRRRRTPQTYNPLHHAALPDRRPDHNLHPTYRKLVTSQDDCAFDEKLFRLNFQTDSYGQETSWFLRSENVVDGTHGDYIGYGPPTGIKYGDFTLYSFSYCLSVGSTYTLAVEDNFGDGMCCTRGYGGYEYSLGGVRIYSTNLLDTFNDYVEHTFTVEAQYTPVPTDQPTEEPVVDMECVPNPTECGCMDVDQIDYRGTISTTLDGIACQVWDTSFPHQHRFNSTKYPDDDLTLNYCRSPGGGPPWCFTTDPDKKWDYCRIPECPEQVKAPTTSTPTISPSEQGPTPPMPTEAPTMGPTVSPTVSPTKSPTTSPTLRPTFRPTPHYNVTNPANGCSGGDVKIRVETRADEWSDDTSWELKYPNGTYALHEVEGSYGKWEAKSSEICVPHGNYSFIIRDKYGDGMCCRYGDGYFKVHLDDHESLNGGAYNDNITAKFLVGYDPTYQMTEREHLYLEAHNVRRKEWHEMYNVSYVPLVYSPALAAKSKAWADELLNSCGIVGIEHEDFNMFGENLAKNTGGANTWGRLYEPDKIVGRWVDFEIGLPYPSNGHLTQALWRASKYLGCGESVKKWRGGLCRIQVCRYARAGNCDMKRYNSTQGENWLEPVMMNYTRCGPECPPEGCF